MTQSCGRIHRHFTKHNHDPYAGIKFTRSSMDIVESSASMHIDVEHPKEWSELAVSIVRSGGVGSLFNGLGVELFRGVLSGAIMLSVKESLTLSVKIFLFTMGGYHEQARLLQVLRRS